MSVPLSATGRITFLYEIDSFPHKYQPYCKILDTGTGSFTLIIRDGSSLIDWKDYASRMADMIVQGMACSIDTGVLATLESRVGTEWFPLDSDSLTVSPITNTSTHGSMLTLSLIDLSFGRVRVELMEPTYSPPFKYLTIPTPNTHINNFAVAFTTDHTDVNDPWQWVVSRGNHYLAANPIRGISSDFNDKLVRARRL